jgi:hypothetical protein
MDIEEPPAVRILPREPDAAPRPVQGPPPTQPIEILQGVTHADTFLWEIPIPPEEIRTEADILTAIERRTSHG